MEIISFWRYALFLLSLSIYSTKLNGQVINTDDRLVWCTVSVAEQYKCGNLSKAIIRDKQLFGDRFLNLSCLHGFDKDECMTLLDDEKADVTSLDSGEVFVAGRYHSLVPILQEVQPGGLRHTFSVAVVKKGSGIGSALYGQSLRGAKACFPAVGTYAGWVLPVNALMAEGGLDIIDCNNHVKSVINFFGSSCAPNALVDKYNPIGDNSDKLCELCVGRTGVRCSLNDPYAGYTGAFRCLLEAGDVAFLKHTTVPHILTSHHEFRTLSPDNFELLCKDGSRRAINDHLSCNWGRAPSNAIVTSTAKNDVKRKRYQRFIMKMTELYSNPTDLNYTNTNDYNKQRNPDGSRSGDPYGNSLNDRDNYGPAGSRDLYGNPINNQFDNEYGGQSWNDSIFNRRQSTSTTENYYRDGRDGRDGTLEPRVIEEFKLFESARYGSQSDLLVEDSTRGLVSLPVEKQHLTGFLGAAEKPVLAIRACPVNRLTLCVTSDPELDKCVKMRSAMKAQLLKPDLSCYKGHSHINCMQAIRSGLADAAMLDAADVWEGARHYSLEPFLAEVYGLGTSSYYAVAVAKEQDPDTELTFLRGKNTCHTGMSTAAGWIYPLAYLISNGWIRPYGCDASRAAAEWFSRSCVPGAVSPEYNAGVPHTPLCRLCHGASFRHCRRDATEAYYGNIGALRCLIEAGGDVAFVRHTAVMETAGGRRREWWARNTLRDDFQLLCPDGTRAPVTDFQRCNLGLVPANAMVTRGGEGHNETEISAYTNLFLYAQQFYGSHTSDDFRFSMFSSNPPYFDLIFSDGTRQVKPLTGADRSASHYLGRVFMRAHRLTDCTPSTSDASLLLPGTLLMLVTLLLLQ